MKSEDLIEEIKMIIEALKADISRLYKALPGLFKAADQLSTINKSLASEIKARLLELNSLTSKPEIISKIEEIKVILAKISQTAVKSVGKTYLGVSEKFRTDEYRKAIKVYNTYETLIEKKEKEIINAPNYSDKLHEPLKKITKKYGYCLHARLTGNLRIIYKVVREKNLAIFLTIIPHDEMDKL